MTFPSQNITYQLLTLYKENNIKVQFKFKNKQNYIFEGEIVELPDDVYYREVTLKNISDEAFINDSFSENQAYRDIHKILDKTKDIAKIKLINGQIAFIRIDFIDFESIIPHGYQAERFYIREPITAKMTEEIFARSNGLCTLKLEGCTNRAECCDHIIPVSAGGLTILENLQAACNNCNLKKGSKII